VKCYVAGGVAEGSDRHRELSKKVLDSVSKQLQFVPSIDCTAARRLLAMTSSSSLLDTDKQELMCRLNDKVDLDESTDASSLASASSASSGPGPAGHAILAETPKKATQVLQDHKYLHNYGKQALWAIICNRSTSIDTKLSTFAIFAKSIGLRYISEKTAAAAAALCRHFSILPDDNQDKALADLRRFKELLRLLWKDEPV